MWYLIGAVFFWGIANFFVKLALNRIPPVSTLILELVGIVAVITAIFIFERPPLTALNSEGVLYAALAGAAVMVGGYLFVKVLYGGELARLMPFTALNVAVSAVLGIFFLKETLTPIQWVGACGMVICAMLLSTK